MNRIQIVTGYISVSIVLCALGAGVAYALDDARCTTAFCQLAPVQPGTRLADLYGSNSLASFINTLFNAAIAVGAMLAVLRLTFAGYLYMTTDAWGSKTKAKEVIGNVILGLLLLLSIWLVLRQINPQLLNLDVLRNLPKAQSRRLRQARRRTSTLGQSQSAFEP